MHPEPLEPVPGDQVTTDTTGDRRTSAWDVRNAPRNYVWLIAFQFGSSAFAFAAVWLITRYTGPEGNGGVVAVIASSQIVQIFLNWTTVAIVRYGVDELVDAGVIARTFWTRFTILAINLAIVLGLAFQWFPLLAEALKLPSDFFWLLLIHFSITAFWVHIQMSMQAAKLLKEQGLLLMLERLIILGGVLVVLGLHLLDVRTAIYCYIAGPASMAVVGFIRLGRLIFVRFAIDAALAKKILVYSVPLLPYWLVGYLSGSYLDAAFIMQFMSKADLGVYSVATQINGMMMQIPTVANTILLPLFLTQQAEAPNERSFFYFRKVLPWLVLGWGLGCAVFAFAAYIAIPLVFSRHPEFAGATLPLWILLASSAFWVPVAVGYAAYANAISATYISLVASCLSAAVNIAANFYLIPRYGLVGCAWATFGAYAISVVVFVIMLRRVAAMPPSWIFLALMPAIAGAIVASYVDQPAWALLTCVVLTGCVAVYARATLKDLTGFLSGLWRTSNASG